MLFGAVPVAEAAGGLLPHQVRAGAFALKKGHVLTAEDCAALAAAGLETITIVRLEPGDCSEDDAARCIAEAFAGSHVRVEAPFTGRANLFAEAAGLVMLDAEATHRFNATDDALTLATLPAMRRVEPGDMVATVKIIPFAVPQAAVAIGLAALGEGRIRIAPFREKRVGVVSLTAPSLKESVIEKTLRITQMRLSALGASLAFHEQVPHDRAALVQHLAGLDPARFDLLLVFGAAAITDRRDVVPAAVVEAGGSLIHLGMPVDPGNLLMLAEWSGKPVVGAPGCARSPKENGFDWVLARLCADLPVSKADIQAMGVGGLLMEIGTRPQPRLGEERRGVNAAAIVLAAGRSTRFGVENKLLAEVSGKPLLAHVLAVLGEAAVPAFVVTGHEAERIAPLARDAGAMVVHNPAFASGIASSIRAGIDALPGDVEAAFVVLGDMPRLSATTLTQLLAAAREDGTAGAFVPTEAGEWGNPVLLRRRHFPALRQLSGDQGARKLLEAARDMVREVAVAEGGVLLDIDTPAALAAL